MNIIKFLNYNTFLKERKKIEDFKRNQKAIIKCQEVMNNYKKNKIKEWIL